jgi:hypothetical protein
LGEEVRKVERRKTVERAKAAGRGRVERGKTVERAKAAGRGKVEKGKTVGRAKAVSIAGWAPWRSFQWKPQQKKKRKMKNP